MATREEMLSALRGAHEAGDTESATRIAGMLSAPSESPSLRDTVIDAASRFGEGVVSGTQNLGTGLATGAGQLGSAILAPYDLAADVVQGRSMGTGNRERRQAIDQFGKEHADTESVNYMVGNATPEMVATGGPIGGVAPAAEAAARRYLPQALAKIGGGVADIGADLGVNAAYSASQAAAKGEDVGEAAKWGAAGTAGGRVLVRTLGGAARPFMSDESRKLAESGVIPTPGQWFGDNLPGRLVRGTEDKLTSLPIVGDIVNYARRRSLKDYTTAEVNESLRPLRDAFNSIGATDSAKALGVAQYTMGNTAKSVGRDAVEAADGHISNIYNTVLPKVYATPGTMDGVLNHFRVAAPKDVTMLDPKQLGQIESYIQQRIQPHLDRAAATGENIPGEVLKEIDSEIGHLARKFSGSQNPQDHSLGGGFYNLQENVRGAFTSDNASAQKFLDAANAAFRKLIPIKAAADRFDLPTPKQVQRAGTTGNTSIPPSEMTQAAQKVLPSTVPDTGSAGRLLFGTLAGGAGIAGAGLGATAGAGAAAAVLYSRPALNFFVNGLQGALPDKVLRGLLSLPPEQGVRAIDQLSRQNPQVHQLLQSLIPQVMRQYATSQGEQP